MPRISFQAAGGAGPTPLNPLLTTGRLTLASGDAVPAADQVGKSTVYYTSLSNNGVVTSAAFTTVLWDGSQLQSYESAEISASVVLPAGVVADVFLYDNAGTLALELVPWTHAEVTITIDAPGVVTWTAHGLSNYDLVVFSTTGALPTGLTAGTMYLVQNVASDTFEIADQFTTGSITTSGTQSGTHTAYVVGAGLGSATNPRGAGLAAHSGQLVKAGTPTHRWVGTLAASDTNATTDSGGGVTSSVGGQRFVWNAYNPVARPFGVRVLSLGSWTVNGDVSQQQANDDPANQVEYVCGAPGVAIAAQLLAQMNVYGGGAFSPNSAQNWIGLDAVWEPRIGVENLWVNTASYGLLTPDTTDAVSYDACNVVQVSAMSPLGRHVLHWVESPTYNGNVTTFYGSNLSSSSSGLLAMIQG